MTGFRHVSWHEAPQSGATLDRFDALRPRPLFDAVFRANCPGLASRQLGLWWPCRKADVRAVYREHAKRCHPDNGGTADAFRALQREYEQLQRLDLSAVGARKRAFLQALLETRDVHEAAVTVGVQPGWGWRWVAQHLDVWAVLTWEGIDRPALLAACPDGVRLRLEWCIAELDE